MDFARARFNMVEGQVRPNRVTDPGIVAAMMDLPREAFITGASRALAYADQDVPVAAGRWLLEPMVIARLVLALGVTSGTRTLVVGGSGYGAAILARIGAAVTALEEPGKLAGLQARLAASCVRDVATAGGPVAAGWPSAAPYAAILIEGAVQAVPEAMLAQLGEGGRLVTVESAGRAGRIGQAVRFDRFGAATSRQVMFDAATPLLPEFAALPAFVF